VEEETPDGVTITVVVDMLKDSWSE